MLPHRHSLRFQWRYRYHKPDSRLHPSRSRRDPDCLLPDTLSILPAFSAIPALLADNNSPVNKTPHPAGTPPSPDPSAPDPRDAGSLRSPTPSRPPESPHRHLSRSEVFLSHLSPRCYNAPELRGRCEAQRKRVHWTGASQLFLCRSRHQEQLCCSPSRCCLPPDHQGSPSRSCSPALPESRLLHNFSGLPRLSGAPESSLESSRSLPAFRLLSKCQLYSKLFYSSFQILLTFFLLLAYHSSLVKILAEL